VSACSTAPERPPDRPFTPSVAGAALGAASGAIGGALTDVGLDDKWMKETAGTIQPGTAALFLLVRKVTADKVFEDIKAREAR
jgi:uncharacterized membrane protein